MADEFANKEYEISDIDRIPLYKGFYHGAEWRINSVWHNSKTEVPDVNTIVLVEKKMVVFGSIKYLQKVKCWAGKDGLISKT